MNKELINTEPVTRYSNVDVDKVKILSDNRNKAVVYRWVNNINQKTYVGSSGASPERDFISIIVSNI